jgi:tRNA-dihydrouridine synthase B
MFLHNNDLLLAPMAGITDSVFRTLCKSQGADITVSEMVSAEGIFYQSQHTTTLLDFNPCERPIGIQLFGCSPDHLARAAKFVVDRVQPDFIDLNAGCPVPKVVNKNGGSSLLKDARLFENILTALVKATTTPVTVKIRSGWHKFEWVDTQFAKIAEDCGVSAITVHPRSQTMGFTGHSFWERIAAVKQAVKIPVIGNGDIVTAEDAVKMKTETGCDALMVGRGAYGNPWIFNQIKNALNNQPIIPITFSDKKSMAIQHLDMFINQYGERCAIREMKKHCAWYIKGMSAASINRDRIFKAETCETLYSILNELDISIPIH